MTKIDWESVASSLLALLDRIEIEEDPSLATQRFDIVEQHGMTVELRERTSGSMN